MYMYICICICIHRYTVTIVNGISKPTYNWGAPSCRFPGLTCTKGGAGKIGDRMWQAHLACSPNCSTPPSSPVQSLMSLMLGPSVLLESKISTPNPLEMEALFGKSVYKSGIWSLATFDYRRLLHELMNWLEQPEGWAFKSLPFLSQAASWRLAVKWCLTTIQHQHGWVLLPSP